MLEPGIKEQLTSYLSSTVTATSTSNIESGLSIVLAPNSTYDLHALLSTGANGDGIRYALHFDGIALINGLVYSEWRTGITELMQLNTLNTNTNSDEIIEIRGLVRTSLGGRMYIYFRKNTDVTDDTPMYAGSYLLARRL